MAGRETPVMAQHAAAKAAYPDAIVFFRLGDFYEMFGSDAEVAAAALELTLTSRNKGKPDEIPMAGVPHHAAHGYIIKLLEQGHKVAICEQMADPKLTKGIVPRQVVRVITPGTFQELTAEAERQSLYLAALVAPGTGTVTDRTKAGEAGYGLALLELSTGELELRQTSDLSTLLSELCSARPAELVLSESLLTELRPGLNKLLPKLRLSSAQAAPLPEDYQERLGQELHSELERQAASLALSYALACSCGEPFPVFRVRARGQGQCLLLDRNTVRHLELFESSSGEERGSLLSVIDYTKSPGGARLLKRRLLSPLLEATEIEARLEEVEALRSRAKLRLALQNWLSGLGDLERLAVKSSRQELKPRDLAWLRRGLQASQASLELLAEEGAQLLELFRLPSPESEQMLGLLALKQSLELALVERVAAATKEDSIFQASYDAELTRYAELRFRGGEAMSDYENRLREETGISGLRIRYTRVFGWYIEVTRSQAGKVPENFRRKQTVAGGERYTLPELDQLAEEIETAEEHFRQRELELLRQLAEQAQEQAASLHLLAAQMAALDVSAGLAELAELRDYVRPQLDASERLQIEGGRHPVVETLAARGSFVENDLCLDTQQERLWILSGPNMAGKSTFLRQAALIVILAQMGSFVPARRAHIGLVDQVLTRVGASDNLAFGESTFMVEMRETAHLLRSASRRSLVIIDELGRGTSTYDGLSIAWATAEHLDQVIRCRSLFATHYHELSQLAAACPGIANYSVSAREHGEDIVFLHRVQKGPASRSYGVAVAKLAGLPEPVLARSRMLLEQFEKNGQTLGRGSRARLKPESERQLSLLPEAPKSPALDLLLQVDPDRLSGLEALQLLAQLKRML